MNNHEPKGPCPNCAKDNVWYRPDCKHCGLNLWTNTFEPLDEYFARRFPPDIQADDPNGGF